MGRLKDQEHSVKYTVSKSMFDVRGDARQFRDGEPDTRSWGRELRWMLLLLLSCPDCATKVRLESVGSKGRSEVKGMVGKVL